jgi:hypothetical protein
MENVVDLAAAAVLFTDLLSQFRETSGELLDQIM